MALLSVSDLNVVYNGDIKRTHAVKGVSFDLESNECLGIVGESGCGKSTIGFALMNLLPPNGDITAGSVSLNGRELTRMSESQLNDVRWTQMAMVFQAAMNALNPVMTVHDQVIEAMLWHKTVGSRKEATRRAKHLFELVGLNPNRLASYPHELSGGMRQRAVVAMSLACEPKVLIADEPTTALDVVVQDQIFIKLRDLRRRLGLGMILISHDIGVIRENCDRILVMYGGRAVEYGPVNEVFNNPSHPYTAILLKSTPHIFGSEHRLVSLGGTPPDLSEPITGCIFAHRCPAATDLCREQEPRGHVLENGHVSYCHYVNELSFPDLLAKTPSFERGAQAVAHESLVSLHGITKRFQLNGGLWASLTGTQKDLRAVNGIDLTIGKGEAVGLIGESGCGKTTTGMVLSRLEELTSGEIIFDGKDISRLRGSALKQFRRRVQVIFQDPYESLNPRRTIYEALEEPLLVHGIGASAADRQELILSMLDKVGLAPGAAIAAKYPKSLSGGQRQRVAIARAMIINPDFIIADEPLSMLDASVKAGIMALMNFFKEEGVTFLIISHDLSIARYMCDRIVVMYLGDIVEIGPSDDVISDPKHPYTRLLLSSVPNPEASAVREFIESDDEPPNPLDRPTGCPFHPRCPQATSACASWEPYRVPVHSQEVACILYTHDPTAKGGAPAPIESVRS